MKLQWLVLTHRNNGDLEMRATITINNTDRIKAATKNIDKVMANCEDLDTLTEAQKNTISDLVELEMMAQFSDLTVDLVER